MYESASSIEQYRPIAGAVQARWREVLVSTMVGKTRVVWPILAAIGLLTLPWTSGNAFWTREALLIVIYALMSTGLVISFGYAGELQFGQIAMFAVGSYVSGILANRGVSDVLALAVISGAGAAAVGLLLAAIALRLSGWALGMVSFFLVLVIPDIVVVMGSITGGYLGLSVTVTPTFFGDSINPTALFIFAAVVLIVWIVFCRNVLASRYGGVLRISRESATLAGSLGLSARAVKLVAYTVGAFPAGVAGMLFTFANQYVGSASFSLDASIAVLAAVILGGSESLYGAIIGAAILQLGPFSSNGFQNYALLAYGAFLVTVAVLLRSGLSGIARSALARLSMAISGSGSASPPSPFDDAGEVARVPDIQSSVAAAQSGATVSQHSSKRESGGLVVSNVSRSFGVVAALRDVSLRANPAEITALIGTNGSGKTTLLNIVSGFIAPDTGSVEAFGQLLPSRQAFEVARCGVARTFQTPRVPRGMSVAEVAASGRYGLARTGVLACGLNLRSARHASRGDRDGSDRALALVGLSHLATQEAVSLPLGARRLLEVARAYCAGARVLLLDEPAAGLSPIELDTLAEVLLEVRAEGTACVLVEHNFSFVKRLADCVYVLHLGNVIATGTPADIQSDKRVAEVYLGRWNTGHVRDEVSQ